MKGMRKLSAILLAVMLCVGIINIPVFAATTSQDGLEVTLTTDKDEYSQGEEITATLTVKNTSEFAVNNVSLKGIIPEGYELAEGTEATKKSDTLEAGKTLEVVVTYVAEANGDSVEDETTKPSTPEYGDDNKDTDQKKENSVDTGDKNNIVIYSVVLFGSLGVMIVILVIKKRGRNLLSILLCITMVGTSIVSPTMRVDAAETEKIIKIEEVIQVDGKDVILKAEVYYQLGVDEDKEVYVDTDEDDVPDVIEEYFGSSIESDDTDGDGLSDYTEIYKTNTDPVKDDTDENGISDADEDLDEDQLSNLKEQEIGTDPTLTDTDDDGLSDGQEIKEYGTDPVKDDTDGDSLIDGDEIELGLDPLKACTDGSTPDNERTFEQTTDDSVKDEALKNSENWLDVRVFGNVPGIINKNVSLEEGSVYSLESNRSVVSDIVDVYIDYETPVTLSFKCSKSYSGDINNLNIMAFTEDGLMPLDTSIDETKGTINCELQKNGTYFVVDLDEFLKGLGIDVFNSLSSEYSVSTFSSRMVVETAKTSEKIYADNNEVYEIETYSDIEDEETIVNEEIESDLTLNETEAYSDVEDEETAVNEEIESDLTLNETEAYSDVEDEETAVNEEVESDLTLNETEAYSDVEDEETAVNEEVDNDLTLYASKRTARVVSSGDATGKADVVFVIDTTGSMGSAIAGVRSNIGSFANALVDEYNIDVNFALIEYRDITVDGNESTKIHPSTSSNWYTNVDNYIKEVNNMSVTGGGDTPETPIDALQMARNLDWRGDATKFVILVTDANSKNDNTCGISDMEEMSTLLVNDNIITSVIARYESDYEQLTIPSGGLYGYIYDDFSNILIQLANMVGEETNSGGEWVFLDDFQAIKLGDTIENADLTDTDGDGYSDKKELGNSEEVNMEPYISLLLNKHSVPSDSYVGKKTLTVWNYISNPTLLDTDYDGISDGTKDYDGSLVKKPDETPRRSSGLWGTDGNRFKGSVTANDFKMNVSFKVDYSLFFNTLSNYNKNLSKMGIIYSIGAYHNDFDINSGADFSGNDESLMKNFGMKDVKAYKVADDYTDDDLSEITIGHREVTYQGVTKDIVLISVRGTDSTIEEWSSNFDVGADNDEYWDRGNDDWEEKQHHKGFDVAANRLDKKCIQHYISNLDASTKKVIYITGHSRGAAIANILAAMYVDRGYTTVAYTMATPNTTLKNNASSYKTIFNIVNSDDIVPQLPLSDWGYDKYGKTYPVSVKEKYEDKFGEYDDGTWEAMFDHDYNYNGNLTDTKKAFSKVLQNREQIYHFTGENDTIYKYGKKYDTEDAAIQAVYDLQDKYGTRISRFCKFYTVESDPLLGSTYYQVAVEQSPAAMMMILTDVIGSKEHERTDDGKDSIVKYSQRGAGEDKFFGQDIGFYVADKYKDAKSEFVWSGADSTGGAAMAIRMGGMLHTHMPGTYYLIINDEKDCIK